jgi:gliding motility-associated lipoprotein GldH
MKRTTLTLLTLSLLLLASCGKKVVLDETHNFKDETWMRFEPENFSLPIENNDHIYRVCVTLRYDTSRLDYKSLPLVVNYFVDSMELHNFMPEIRLRDRNGKLRGEVYDHYCTVSDTIDRYRLYNRPGTYTYSIKQRTSKYSISGLTSITLKVERVEK